MGSLLFYFFRKDIVSQQVLCLYEFKEINMFTIICLAWVGMQLNAPTWYFTLLVIMAVLKIISFGLEMYNKGRKTT